MYGIVEGKLAKEIDTITQKAIESNRLVGSVLLIKKNDKLLYHKALGYADRESEIPMQEDTIFRLSSVSKIYTSLAIAVLVTQKKLSFDDDVVKWLPYFTPRLPNGEIPRITIRQLLSHTSGLTYTFSEAPNGPYHSAGISDGLDNTRISLEENLHRLASVPLLYEPGTSWSYSLGMDVLGGIIEKVMGMSLPHAMQELIEKPFNLKNSGYFLEDKNNVAVPYYNVPLSTPQRMEDPCIIDIGVGGEILFAPERIFNKEAFPSGGAGMVGTASDVMTLLEVIRKNGSSIISAEVIQEMNKAYAIDIGRPGLGYALGWMILNNRCEAKSPQGEGTLSWGGVYGHSWFVDPLNDLSVVILTNTTPEGLFGELLTNIHEAIYKNIS